MTVSNALKDELLRPLLTTEGGFAMVALDQRESLREMYAADANGDLVGDDVLREFKVLAAGILSPYASGVLLDREFGVTGSARPEWIAEDCGLILAADVLNSVRGQGVQSTELDPLVTPKVIAQTGAAAVKFLVMWRRGHHPEIDDAVAAFLDLAASAGVASFVEGIVRPERDQWLDAADRHAAIIEAAGELSRGASVYKGEVPGYVHGDVSQVREHSEQLSSVVDGPWVVLSNGVNQQDFVAAVNESLAGGSHGFLAGRAVWADTINEPDQAAALTSRSVQRLTTLSDAVKISMLGRAESSRA
jgi:sulfofructosephosphate aldolase